MTLEAAILARIDATTALTDLLATPQSVWAVLAPQGSALPYLTYEVVNEQPNEAMGTEINPLEARFVVNIFADSFDELVNITTQVRGCFNRLSGTVGGVVIQDCMYEGRNDLFDETDRDWMRALDYRCFYEA